jgi:hypothetical protein
MPGRLDASDRLLLPQAPQASRKKDDEIQRISVPCRTLSSLMTEMGVDEVDLLQIDAEGFDAAIVRMALSMPDLPRCINFEHIHLTSSDRKSIFNLLNSKGYLVAYGDWDILALQKPLLEQFLQGPSLASSQQ